MNSARFPLRILLVVGRGERAAMIERSLTDAGHKIASTIPLDEDWPTAVQRFQPEALVIETEVPARELLRGLRRSYERQPLPVVIFADRSDGEVMRDAIKIGVSAFVVDGLAPNRVVPVLEAAVTRFLEFQTLRSERDEALAKLGERRAIER